jgi:hypothetical protein
MKTTPSAPPARRAVMARFAEQQRRMVAATRAAAMRNAFKAYSRRTPTTKGK